VSTSRKGKCCTVCGARSNLFLCNKCADEVRDLLYNPHGDERGQPGIAWYIGRLIEQAYGQARLGTANGSKSTSKGYALLVDKRAVELLARIHATLGVWVWLLTGLSATESDEIQRPGTMAYLRAKWLSQNVKDIRKQADSGVLHADLLAYAKEAWKIINRPADNCCGPCPSIIKEKEGEMPCAVLLYADEKATVVQCPKCRARHNVDELREALRIAVRDMLFTSGELRKLMDTRLNDRMPKATFYKMIQDGRLTPRAVADDGVKMYTYEDVCAAREKPVPARRLKVKNV